MRFKDIISMAWKNLTASRMRSLLTILGISVGIGTIVFLISLGYGLQDLSIRQISSISSLTALDVVPASGSIVLNQNTLDEFTKIPNVEKVSPMLSLTGQIVFGNQVDAVSYAVNPDYFSFQNLKISSGGVFNQDENKVVVSSAVLKALGKREDEVLGKEIKFVGFLPKENSGEFDKKEINYSVCGVISDETSAFVYLPLTSIKPYLNDKTVYNSTKVKVASTDQIQNIRLAIESKGFKVTSIADTIDQVYSFFRYIQITLALFGMIALIVASIGMFNTMTIALLERTRDIGIMKAIGVQNKSINWMFMSESFLISFFGGIFGIVSGVIVAQLMDLLIQLLAKSVGSHAEKIFSVPIVILLLILAFSVFVGILTGFYPSRRAGKLNPLDALRYE